MKNLISIVTGLALLAVLTGCGGKPDSPVFQDAESDGTQSSQWEQAVSSQEEPSSSVEEQAEEPDFTSVEIEVTQGTLQICTGASFSLTRQGEPVTDYEIDNGTLYFKSGRTGDTVLTLEEGGSYEGLHLMVGDGHVNAQDLLEIQTLQLEVTRGEVKLESVCVEADSTIRIEQGSAFVSGDLGDNITASCREGNLNLEVPFAQDDANYELDLSEGELRLGRDSYHGRSGSKTIDNGAGRTMNLTCSRGNLSVEFGKI